MSKLLLLGGTGLVGRAVIGHLKGFDLTLLSRRSVGDLPPGFREIIEPNERWPAAIVGEAPAIVVNCLGTTIKQAGSQEAFRHIDHDLVVAVARAAKTAGAHQCISVSSVGASARSRNFYLRTKGEAEDALAGLAFDRLDIMRPGLLLGQRPGPPRFGESLAMIAAPVTNMLMQGALRRYRAISADCVAKAIVALAGQGGEGTHVHENDAMHRLAD
jgi:uncharacterized protein YbjT (DUF2867 family)